MGNVLDARERLGSFSSGARPRQQRRQAKAQHHKNRHEEERKAETS
jgi:hypothetical protein